MGCLLFGAPAPAQGPTPAPRPADRVGTTSVEMWAGFGARSSHWGFLGDAADRSFAIVAARVTHRIHNWSSVGLDYTVDAIPYARLTPAPALRALVNPPVPPCEGPPGTMCTYTVSSNFYASGSATARGVNPVGLELVFHPDQPWQFRMGASGGALWFDRAVPVIYATRFNFTGMIEAGAQYLTRQGRGVTVMYRLHHLSNAGIGTLNPGVASHILSLGVRWRLSP